MIYRLKEGRFVIPHFQREFEWRPWDIRELMRSVFLDYNIGSLLLWKGKRENDAQPAPGILFASILPSGKSPTGGYEDVGTYIFRVVK